MKFQKGQSGNPKGRPKLGKTFAEALRVQLALERDGVTTRDRVVAVAVDLALDGDLDAIKWVVERVDGKVPDRLEADLEHRVGPTLDAKTRLAILADAARRRGLGRGA